MRLCINRPKLAALGYFFVWPVKVLALQLVLEAVVTRCHLMEVVLKDGLLRLLPDEFLRARLQGNALHPEVLDVLIV